jgi:hypothetical protein
MAITKEQVLRLLNEASEWARRGERIDGRHALTYSFVDDWSGFKTITVERPKHFAVSVDERMYFSDELERLEQPGFIQAADPACVIFRLVEGEGKAALAFLHSEKGPGHDEIKGAVGHGIYNPESARLRAAAVDALATDSESTRSRSSRDR